MGGFGVTELIIVLFGLIAPIVLIFIIIGILTFGRRSAERYEEKYGEWQDTREDTSPADTAERRREDAANEIDSTEHKERLRYHGRER